MTENAWLELEAASGSDPLDQEPKRPDPAKREVERTFSDILRSSQLVVLSGLGTSLCVKDDSDNTKAPTMWALWEAVSSAYKPQADDGAFDELLKIVRQPKGNTNIEELLSRCKIAENFAEDGDLEKITSFITLAESEIRKKVDFIDDNESLPIHESFLRRIGRRSTRRDRLKLFTTNYDRCFEHAAQRSGFIVIDGFSFSSPQFFDPTLFEYDIVRRNNTSGNPDFIENVFHLYKIHGSIDWELNPETGSINKCSKPENPLLIYPRSTKYELAFSRPYLEMISAFQSEIRKPDVGIIVVGFGFNDSHIAEPLLSAIETNLSMRITIVAPDLESSSNSYIGKFRELVRQGDARITLVNGKFEELVPLVPDIIATTDLERHADRMRAIREM